MKFIIAVLMSIVIFGCATDTQPVFDPAAPAPSLVEQEGLWGYEDTNGTITIPFQFEDAKEFSQGLAAVRNESGWYYINTSGAPTVTPRFGVSQPSRAGSFSDGRAPVYYDGARRWVYVNVTGDTVAQAVSGRWYARASEFSDGRASVEVLRVRQGSGGIGEEWVISPNGTILHPTTSCENKECFEQGLKECSAESYFQVTNTLLARHEITGTSDQGCVVETRYIDSVDEELHNLSMTLEVSEEGLFPALENCFTDGACEGPLAEAFER